MYLFDININLWYSTLVMKNSKRLRISPSLKIIAGFVMVILIGTLLLCLPISNNDGHWLSFVDSFFTSTSAVCVTGLIVVDTAVQFTLFGKIVILLLIQIGGLGIIDITSLIFLLLRKKINLYNRMAIQESINKDTIQGVVRFIKKTIIITFIIEGIGALLLLYSTISFSGNFWTGLFYAVFMSVSAFCNAGFDILGTQSSQFSSIYAFAGDVTMLLPLMFLIIIGGIGFVVLLGGFKNIKSKQHTKVVLWVTSILILVGAVIFLICEWNNPNTIGEMSFGGKLLNSFFQSVAPRTAGFATIDQNSLTAMSRITTMFLMFVGGSPNSTAGGIKTTTLFILFMFMFRLPNANGDIRVKDKKISRKVIMKAIRLILYTILTLVIAIALIRLLEPSSVGFESIVFECISAISTVGLTMGITPLLTVPSKIVLAILMFVGRVGLVTIAMAFASKGINAVQDEIEYPNTDIIV